ncbi:4'-phosphopantetheinyl transferase family protein [Roseofilum casamattae]|uniref:4'-phosphopantetheinyl transferase superfamily protein n=1 Tax=Roseofilum casamattae BLCC-M143 TaxID=3022442 RepID=A0ABT7BYV7_9CYAN|nr:4'-phosphopantetheinyl transferase superfamily protein [Roseofilum casamattae]MDJ1184389.1 4'-phosphopantetheinyl transferase superfamily protein [Roseofilum casamattae BLCC-M143]
MREDEWNGLDGRIGDGLGDRQIHIWHVDLQAYQNQVPQFFSLLSPDEVERAQRFHFPEHRDYFILARGILRRLLAGYLQIQPKVIQFAYSDRGKPSLASPASDLNFNLSHSQGRAVYGFVWHQRIGVDLEVLRPMPNALSLAKRFFLPREYEAIASATPSEQSALFFRYWTYKEAYLKARGIGLVGLEEAEVILNENSASISLSSETETTDWHLFPLERGENTLAAAAVPGDNWQIEQFCLPL